MAGDTPHRKPLGFGHPEQPRLAADGWWKSPGQPTAANRRRPHAAELLPAVGSTICRKTVLRWNY